MVAIDDYHNGWRTTILPMACVDEVIMDSVLAVSTFHLQRTTCDLLVPEPNELYVRALRGLQKRQHLDQHNTEMNLSVFTAIIVLLVCIMVNGHADFPILYRMLRSALDAVGGESGLGSGDVSAFLIRQIRK